MKRERIKKKQKKTLQRVDYKHMINLISDWSIFMNITADRQHA